MLEIKRNDGIWVTFYPIISLDMAGEGDTIDERVLSKLTDKIYGKYAGGVAGYNVWWVYETVSKSKLREVAPKTN